MTDQMTHAEYSDEIESLRARVAELESAKPICPMCASQIDEAAGVDLVGLKQQLADVENDYSICKHSLEQLKHDLILKNAQLAACEKERDDLRKKWGTQCEHVDFLEEQLAACEKERDELLVELSTPDEHVIAQIKYLHGQIAASQHYAQQLRDALVNIEEFWNRDRNESAMEGACWHAVNTAHEALSIPNNTSALDQLKAGYELRIKTLREMVARWMCDEGWDQCDMDEVDRLDATQDTSTLDALVNDAERMKKLLTLDSPTVCEFIGEEWVPVHPLNIIFAIDLARGK